MISVCTFIILFFKNGSILYTLPEACSFHLLLYRGDVLPMARHVHLRVQYGSCFLSPLYLTNPSYWGNSPSGSSLEPLTQRNRLVFSPRWSLVLPLFFLVHSAAVKCLSPSSVSGRLQGCFFQWFSPLMVDWPQKS